MKLRCRLGWHSWMLWRVYGEPQPFEVARWVRDGIFGDLKRIPKGQGMIHTQRSECFDCGRERYATRRVGVSV